MKKIKELSKALPETDTKNLSILGALNLYLDFINLFLYVIRLLGKRRR